MAGRISRVVAGLAAVCMVMAAAPSHAADAAGAYVVVVDYAADAAHFAELKHLVDGIARASIREPGCRRFDVVEPVGTTNHLTLYEVFDDKAAFAAHAASAPFKQFGLDTAALNATRTATPGMMVLTLHNP